MEIESPEIGEAERRRCYSEHKLAIIHRRCVPEDDEVKVVGVLHVVHDADETMRGVVASPRGVTQVDGRVVSQPSHPLGGCNPADAAAWQLFPECIENEVVSIAVDVIFEAVVRLVSRH